MGDSAGPCNRRSKQLAAVSGRQIVDHLHGGSVEDELVEPDAFARVRAHALGSNEATVASGIWTKTLGISRQRSPKCSAKTRIRRPSTQGHTTQVSRGPWADRGPFTVSDFVSYGGSELELESLPLTSPTPRQCCLRQSLDCRHSQQCPLS